MLFYAAMAFLAVFICFGGNYLTGQTMLERPLVVGLVTGLLMGDMHAGILMGAALEAIFLGNVNIGGVIAAEPVTATVLATSFTIVSGVEQSAALTLAIPIGILAAIVIMFMKNVFMNIFAPLLDRYARENDQTKIVLLHYGTWVIYYTIVAAIAFVGVYLGSGPVNAIVDQIPATVMSGLKAAGGLLPVVGFAMLMNLLWTKELAIYYILGFVLTAYMELPAVAVATLGVIICVMVGTRDYQMKTMMKQAQVATPTSAPSAQTRQEAEEEDFFA
ncbi:MAG: PTS mannose/fructose/sorbose/N-acetylgalactosamine transporter subunit IIC [Aerococcus sp.]|nr:PTS mannose/fructose/sorbose/N-acetylgalactosamine transporter subunit IIC [Aerococcus sp.]